MSKMVNAECTEEKQPTDITTLLDGLKNKCNRILMRVGKYYGLQETLQIVSGIIFFLLTLRYNAHPYMKFIAIASIGFSVAYRIYSIWANRKRRDTRILKQAGFRPVISAVVTLAIICVLDGNGSFRYTGAVGGAFLWLLSLVVLLFDVPSGRKNWKWQFLRLSLVLIWGYVLMIVIHQFFADSLQLQRFINSVVGFIYPRGETGIIGYSGWISSGFTFFLGCMAIINWSKGIPCKVWNPYSAQELHMTKNVLGFATAILGGLIYVYGSGLHRASFFLAIGLFMIDLYTLFLCNSQSIHGIVRRKIIQMIDPLQIANHICVQPGIGIGEHEKDSTNSNLGNRGSDLIARYGKEIMKIGKTVLASKQSKSQKADELISLAKDMLGCIEYVPDPDKNIKHTMGFVFGYCCCPQRVKNRAAVVELEAELLARAADDEDHTGFFEMMRRGIMSASLNDMKSNNKSVNEEKKRSYEENVTHESQSINYFFQWLLSQEESKSTSYMGKTVFWNWAKELSAERTGVRNE